MKTQVIILSFLVIAFSGCNKIIPDLPRDNPLDNTTSTNPNDKKLVFSSYEVACKYDSGAVTYSTENTIKHGDRVFLQIRVKNSGGANISGIRATLTSSSGLVQITQLSSGFYIKLTEGSETNDYINSSSIGYATITDGQSFRFADNYNSYAIEFKVSSIAIPGNLIPFLLTMTDNSGGSWTQSFNVTVN